MDKLVTFYNVEIQMSGTYETSPHFIAQIATDLGAVPTDIDELETYSAKISFKSTIKPSEMRNRIRAILAMYNRTLYYIDVIYLFENEFKPDKFCFWADGHEVEYHGKIIFEEDK